MVEQTTRIAHWLNYMVFNFTDAQRTRPHVYLRPRIGSDVNIVSALIQHFNYTQVSRYVDSCELSLLLHANVKCIAVDVQGKWILACRGGCACV